jgi:hypothetical protein
MRGKGKKPWLTDHSVRKIGSAGGPWRLEKRGKLGLLLTRFRQGMVPSTAGYVLYKAMIVAHVPRLWLDLEAKADALSAGRKVTIEKHAQSGLGRLRQQKYLKAKCN